MTRSWHRTGLSARPSTRGHASPCGRPGQPPGRPGGGIISSRASRPGRSSHWHPPAWRSAPKAGRRLRQQQDRLAVEFPQFCGDPEKPPGREVERDDVVPADAVELPPRPEP